MMSSAYMRWAKLQAGARYNLATSGVANLPASFLQATPQDLELTGPSYYGYAPLQEAIARQCGVSDRCVFAADGTSLANHLAMAAVLAPGDEVLIEHPTYELLLSTARYLGARVERFPRPARTGFQPDLEALARAATRRTRLIVLTNLHNPSSALLPDSVLRQIGALAARIGALVLVDEVYLDAAFGRAPSTAFRLGDNFISTSSLTKVYGLAGLRCGWVLARPALVQKLWRLNDLFGVIPAHPAERLSVLAFRCLAQIRARSRCLLEANHRLLDQFLAVEPDLDAVSAGFGTVVFARWRRGQVAPLCRRLRDPYETSVVPGRFFEMPNYIRIGLGSETPVFAAGLERLAAALADLRSRRREEADQPSRRS